MAALASAGLFASFLFLPAGPALFRQQGPGAAGVFAALDNPLRLLSLRSPGERGPATLLKTTKRPRVAAPAPPAGPAAPRLAMLRSAPLLAAPLEAGPVGPLAASPLEPAGWLRGPPEAPFGVSPDDLWIYPPLLPPPLGPWPEEPLIVVVGPTPPPPIPPTPPPPPPPIPEPSTWLMLILGVFSVGAMLRRRRGAASLTARGPRL